MSGTGRFRYRTLTSHALVNFDNKTWSVFMVALRLYDQDFQFAQSSSHLFIRTKLEYSKVHCCAMADELVRK